MEDGGGAHGAGLERDVKCAVEQAVVGEGAAGGAEGDDLGVGRRIGVANDAIGAGGKDLVLVDEDGANGDFAGSLGVEGLGDGGAQEELVGGQE